MSYVITGATGQLGRLVVDGLLETVPADQITAVVRSAERAAELAARGVAVHVADYDAPATLKGAFRSGDRVLLISGNEVGKRIPQHTAVIDAAREAGVALLAYTGILGGPAADFALADEHRATEQAVLDSGLPYVFLRNGWYSEVYTEKLAGAVAQGAVVGSSGEGRIASAARADYAAAAVAVLTGTGPRNTAYELSGDAAWTLTEYAAELARQTGRPVVFREVPADEHLAILLAAGLPEGFARLLVDVDAAVSRGRLALANGDLSRLIGRPTTPLADTVAAALAAG